MVTIVDAVFEHGVFRPLGPVELPENQLVGLHVIAKADVAAPIRWQPLPYPEETGLVDDDSFEYKSVPPKSVTTITVNCTYVGRHEPAPYPEDYE